MRQPRTHVDSHGKELSYWSSEDISEAWADNHDLKLVADGCRLNALSAIHQAGSGHIGTSFSSLDIMVAARAFLHGDDFLSGKKLEKTFFSSKGHDAPAFYAVLHAGGELSYDQLFSLRRLGGLPGHPETVTPGVVTNTGSLGMGISKAKGFIKAQRLRDPASRQPVITIIGDGELNEGQIWESMPGAVKEGFSELVAIVDANSIQSDTWTELTLPMGNIRQRVEGVGWHFMEVEGNDPQAVYDAIQASTLDDRPTLIFAKTVKGSGIPWMEKFPSDGEFYHFHSGALSDDLYDLATEILVPLFQFSGDRRRKKTSSDIPRTDSTQPKHRPPSMVTLWENRLVDVMNQHPSVIALDGDLSYDTGTHIARRAFPERYLQSGIAEQDMVSVAGTLALSGYTPVVHSFSTFLTMRAAEQIFNNATEGSRVIYMGFLAGLIPSAAGFSHQAVTDVGVMASFPGMRVFEPSNSHELQWSIDQALDYLGPSYVRMGAIAPVAEKILDSSNGLNLLAEGRDVAIVSSGPLFNAQALAARAAILDNGGLPLAVYSMPEISAPISPESLKRLAAHSTIFVLENHNPAVAKYHHLREAFKNTGAVEVIRLGLDGLPANGQPAEVLEHHSFDVSSLAQRISGNRPTRIVTPDKLGNVPDAIKTREAH